MDGAWDAIIAFPPCTYLSNAGARHLYPGGVLNRERYLKGMEAKEFFMRIWDAKCERVVIENPVSSRVFEMPAWSQEIQPWHFGHPYTKKTRLWIRGLPLLVPDGEVEPVGPYCPSGTGARFRKGCKPQIAACH